MTGTYGDSFFDGPEMQAAKGPLLGGGLTQVGTFAVRKLMPSMAKHAPLIGTILGAGVSGFLMTKPQHKEAGAAGLATALIIGLPNILDAYMGTGLLHGADDLSAYTSEMGADEMAAYTSEMGANALELMDAPTPVQIEGSEMGAITSEMGETPQGISIQGDEISQALGSSF